MKNVYYSTPFVDRRAGESRVSTERGKKMHFICTENSSTILYILYNIVPRSHGLQVIFSILELSFQRFRTRTGAPIPKTNQW